MNHANANYMGIPLLDTDDNIQIMEMNDREFHARVYGTENTPYRATLEELIGYQDVDYIFGIKWYMCICGHQFQHPTECSDHLKTHQHIFYIKTHINSSLFLRHRWQIVCEQIRAPDTDTYDEFYVDTDTDDYSEEETDNEQSFSRTIDTDNDPPENQCISVYKLPISSFSATTCTRYVALVSSASNRPNTRTLPSVLTVG